MEENRQKDNMGSALKRRDYLTLLANSKDVKRRKALLDVATKQEIDAISVLVKHSKWSCENFTL